MKINHIVESTEQVNELSKDTLKSYFPKRVQAARQMLKSPEGGEVKKAARITNKDLPRAMSKLKDPEYGRQGTAEDAEPVDREWALVKKLGRLGERIVQNPRLWERYSEAIDTGNNDWIIGLIQDGTGADKTEIAQLDRVFGQIGGGLGRLVDFAWAVKENTWKQDFMNPYRLHRAQSMEEGVAEGSKDSAPKMSKQERKLAQGALKGAKDMSAALGLVRDKDGVLRMPKNKEQGVAESISVVDQDYDLDQMHLTLDIEGKKVSFTYWDYEEDFSNAERKDVFDQLQEQPWYKGLDHPTKMEILDAAYRAIRGLEPQKYRPTVDDEPLDEQGVAEGKKEADYGADYQDMVARVKQLAGQGPRKTVWDEKKRVYKTVPVSQQGKNEKNS